MPARSIPPVQAVRSAPRFHAADGLVIALIFLIPSPASLGAMGARAVDAVRFGSALLRLLVQTRRFAGRHVGQISVIMLSMVAFSGLSLAWGISQSLRDLLDVMRVAAFWVIFLFGAALARKGEGDYRAATTFAAVLFSVGVLNAAFTICQYLFPGITRPVQELYCVAERHLDLIAYHGRAIGFFGNPNTNAIMLLLFSCTGLVLYLLTNSRWHLLLGVTVYSTVLLAGSKTGLVLAGIVATSVCLVSGRVSYVMSLAVAAVVTYFALGLCIESGYVDRYFPYIKVILYRAYDAVDSGTFDLFSIKQYQDRLEIWDDTLQWFYRNPLLGSGPLRDVLPSWADNYYVYVLSRYGAIGLVHFALLLLYVLGLSLRAASTAAPVTRAWGLGTFAAFVVLTIANHTIDAFLIVQVASLCMLSAGYLAGLMDGNCRAKMGAATATVNVAGMRKTCSSRNVAGRGRIVTSSAAREPLGR